MEQKDLKQGLRVKTYNKGEGIVLGFYNIHTYKNFISGKDVGCNILVQLINETGHGGVIDEVDFNGNKLIKPSGKNYWFYDLDHLTIIETKSSPKPYIKKQNTSLEDTIKMLEEMEEETQVTTKIIPKFPSRTYLTTEVSSVSSNEIIPLREEVLKIAKEDAKERVTIDPSVFLQTLPTLNTNL